jgi:very-short-patch-repair endonuclease
VSPLGRGLRGAGFATPLASEPRHAAAARLAAPLASAPRAPDPRAFARTRIRAAPRRSRAPPRASPRRSHPCLARPHPRRHGGRVSACWSLVRAIGRSIEHQAVWALVRRQQRAISRTQLRAFGFSRDAIAHRIERGRLVLEWPGVYRVGPLPLERDGRFMAAVLACGPGAVLSHESAAALLGIRTGGADPIHVSIPANRSAHHDGIEVHRRDPVPPATTFRGIPVSRPLFTLVDLAATLDRDALERAVNAADVKGLIRADAIVAALAAVPAYPGVAILRDTLARYRRTDSDLERRFLALLREHRLPLPETQEHLGRGRIDFHWPELGLVVETDGLTYHRTPIQQLEDRLRDQAHTAAGRTQLRIANLQIRESPAYVAEMLGRVIARLRAERA